MTRPASDRIAGLVLLAVAAAIAAETRSFKEGFLADPVGPRALPFLVAALIGLGGLLLLVHPEPEPSWPSARVGVRMVTALGSFALYGVCLAPLGFLLSTTLEVTALSVLFSGPPLRSLVAAGALAGVLYVVFVYGLGLALPVGRIFLL